MKHPSFGRYSLLSLLLAFTFFSHQTASAQAIISTLYGTSVRSFSGDGGPATAATFNYPEHVTIDGAGNMYIADKLNNRVRKIDAAGIISTVAGTGTAGYSGDGGPGTAAMLSSPTAVTVDAAGNVLIADYCRVRKLDPTGIITTIAGNGSTTSTGDGGPATAATLYDYSIVTDAAGNIYIGDVSNYVVRKINTAGIISTYAGTGIAGTTGDGGPATAARVEGVGHIAMDATGNMYLPDMNSRIRKVNSSGIISTYAGVTATGHTGDGGPAAAAQLGFPSGVASDGTGNLYIVDYNGQYIRKVDASGTITTVAGSGVAGCYGDGGPATAADVDLLSVTTDAAGNLYLGANMCSYIRKISFAGVVPITGTLAVCTGHTSTLADATYGGVWTSGSPSIASVGSSSGVVTSVTAGTATISYTVGSTTVVGTMTVNTAPAAITGASAVCVGSATGLADATTGGTWASSNPSVATVDLGGFVHGASVGTTTITYALASGCFVTKSVTVVVTPSAITGPSSICVGASDVLTDLITGGIWTSSSHIAIGSVTGLITGASAGTAIITYALGTGCISIFTLTVLPAPASITGLTGFCVGSSHTFSCTSPVGTWSSSNTSVLTVAPITGAATGVGLGTATITYSLSSGCYSTITDTVIATPCPIVGLTSVCTGSVTTLAGCPAGGSWSSAIPTMASINSTTGIVAGISAGTVMLTYSIGTGCMVTTIETVYPSPAPITGTTTFCVGGATVLHDLVPGGTWTSSNPSIATAGSTGVVTATTVGTSVITYALPGGCLTTFTLTVLPAVPTITGPTIVCDHYSITLSNATSGGTWSSSSTSVATAEATTGIVTGVTPGPVMITYSLGTGCISTSAIVVNPVPPGIMGTTATCVGSTVTLANSLPGGIWSSTDPSIATTATTGVVTGVSSGTATITYLVTGGCYASVVLTVSPAVPAITGSVAFCIGGSITLSDATSGGTWSSSAPSVATTSTAGVVSGVTNGTATISYSISTGCYATTVVTVLPLPASITGTPSACVGRMTTLASTTTGGTWSSSNSAVAVVGSGTGAVSGVAAGTAVISYSAGGCIRLASVTITSPPAVFTVTGSGSYCSGGPGIHIGLSGSASGVVYQLFHGATPVGGPVSGTGSPIDFGLITGAFTYIVIATNIATGCTTPMAASASISMLPLPAAITGSSALCAGVSATLSDATTGGTWSSSDAAVASIGSGTGTFTGVSAGTATITYTLGTGCLVTNVVTVNPMPATITGTMAMCVGASVTLADATTGGTWSSNSTGIASIDATGNALGVAAGTATISYELSTGCRETAIVTVNALPTVAVSSAHSCGNTYTLTATGGATYSWAPGTGLSCTTCASTSSTPSISTTYTVTATDALGCSDTASVALDGNRISGYISYTGSALDTFKVWLIQFNSTDTSLSALDSTYTCMDGGTPYYEFMGQAAGNYMVKAQLQGAVPGASGYIPTYSLSTTHWDSAATVSHTASWDTLHINMVYGTVPPGPGFIGGYISAGAGRGTAGDAPVSDMQIILMNTANSVLTYTYTDAAGNYAFTALGYGDYIIYPEFFGFNTIHSDVISLSSASETIGHVNFRKYNDSKVIIPAFPSAVRPMANKAATTVYPNPSAGSLNIAGLSNAAEGSTVMIADVTGREVLNATVKADKAGVSEPVDISMLQNGVYSISIRSAGSFFTCKLVVEK